jgi:nitrogen fixation protein FixH
MTSAETPAATGIRTRRWALIVVGVLTAQSLLIVTLVTIATRDPSFAVEPAYYEKAVRWDDEARERAHTRELGWTADAAFVPGAGATLLVVLRDRTGTPLEDATAQAEYFHQARAGERLRATLKSVGDGRYESPAGILRAGVYEVRLTISFLGEHATLVVNATCPPGATP